jgi:hypothetical protein
MIRPDPGKWDQTADDLRRLATTAENPRTRERFLVRDLGRDTEAIQGPAHILFFEHPELRRYEKRPVRVVVEPVCGAGSLRGPKA